MFRDKSGHNGFSAVLADQLLGAEIGLCDAHPLFCSEFVEISRRAPVRRNRITRAGLWSAGRDKEKASMASDKRVHVTLECTECKRRNYITNKSKVNDRERIELKKYCKWDRKHTTHKETR